MQTGRTVTPTGRADRISVIVPAKELSKAKSRLLVPAPQRIRIAQDLVAHTLEIVRRSERVGLTLVVTRDPIIADIARDHGARVVPEGARSNLNSAVERGCEEATSLCPTQPVAVVVADLPRLTPEDLDEVIDEYFLTRSPLIVPDQHFTGTTMLVQGPTDRCPFLFGPGSASAHARAGYRQLHAAAPTARFDLDTLADLGDSAVAPWTRRRLAGHTG